MSFIFNRKKGPVELVKSTKKHIDILQAAQADDEKTIKKVHRTLTQRTDALPHSNRCSLLTLLPASHPPSVPSSLSPLSPWRRSA